MRASLWSLVVCLSIPASATGKDWKVFCMPEKHLDAGWVYLPQDALDQGYPGSVEDFQNFITIRALFMRGATAKFPREAQYRWTFDAAWQLEQAEKYLPRRMDEIRRLVNYRWNKTHPSVQLRMSTPEEFFEYI